MGYIKVSPTLYSPIYISYNMRENDGQLFSYPISPVVCCGTRDPVG